MRGGLILILLFLGTHVSAQLPVQSSMMPAGESTSFVSVTGALTASSAKFNNRFASALLFSDELDATTIENQMARLHDDKNRIGLDYEWGIQGGVLLGASNLLLVKLSDGAHFDASLPREAASLIFQGNKGYLGDTVSASGLDLYGIRYQQFGLGWAYQPTGNLTTYVMASYINGEQLVRANLDRTDLYTSTLGDTLWMDAKADIWQSDTGRSGFASPNGAGLGVDFGVQALFGSSTSTWLLRAEVHHLGMVWWNSKTVATNIDTTLQWTGVAIDDLESWTQSAGAAEVSDSLNESITGLQNRDATSIWLPGSFHASLMQRRDQGSEFGGGVVLRWNANYLPYGYLVGGYRFTEALAAHLTLGYGGYGTFQAGLRAGYQTEQLDIVAGINNLEALVLPGRFGGGGAFIQAQFRFL